MKTDIDQWLADTWLQAISLHQGAQFQTGEGRQLWQRCVDNVARAQDAMRAAEYSDGSIQHIIYACCALLDEAVKGRGVQDDACLVWYQSSLQTHFFSTLDAGEALYERMRQVLREPAPDVAVLTCFHRVLALGFLGGYRPEAEARRQLTQELERRVPAFQFRDAQPVLNAAPLRRTAGRWLRDPLSRVLVSLLAVALLWWGLNGWLTHLLTQLLPGSAP
ncbi:DotU family type IV/VI secretion system protein [Salmonella enterica subsp. enterica]|nr:DotU family type IV/VI secretion system protein [Salmonella enterica subsp. enterica]